MTWEERNEFVRGVVGRLRALFPESEIVVAIGDSNAGIMNLGFYAADHMTGLDFLAKLFELVEAQTPEILARTGVKTEVPS